MEKHRVKLSHVLSGRKYKQKWGGEIRKRKKELVEDVSDLQCWLRVSATLHVSSDKQGGLLLSSSDVTVEKLLASSKTNHIDSLCYPEPWHPFTVTRNLSSNLDFLLMWLLFKINFPLPLFLSVVFKHMHKFWLEIRCVGPAWWRSG